MINWLKKHFIPHSGNDHRPHFLRKENIRAILGIVLVVELLAFALPTLNFSNLVDNSNLGAVLPAVLSNLSNNERLNNNLPVLRSNPVLDEAARLKAEDMASKGYFAHTSPEGRTPWYWLDVVNYRYDYAGENLAINFSDSEDVTEAWMNSPTHRANIVKSFYTEVGTGVATGVYEGRETIFVAQVYANPKPAQVVVATQTQKPTEVVEESPVVKENNSTQVLGETTDSPELSTEPTLVEKVIASPRHSTNVIFFVIFGIMVVALFLNITIRPNLKHSDLVTNGLLVIVVIGGVFVLNNYLGTKNIVIGQSIDYSARSVQESI